MGPGLGAGPGTLASSVARNSAEDDGRRRCDVGRGRVDLELAYPGVAIRGDVAHSRLEAVRVPASGKFFATRPFATRPVDPAARLRVAVASDGSDGFQYGFCPRRASLLGTTQLMAVSAGCWLLLNRCRLWLCKRCRQRSPLRPPPSSPAALLRRALRRAGQWGRLCAKQHGQCDARSQPAQQHGDFNCARRPLLSNKGACMQREREIR